MILEELISIHNEVMSTTPISIARYLKSQMNWDAKVLCVYGDRGVGKTTLLCQVLLEKYKTAEKALYFSADNINVISYGLFATAKEYFSQGGQALFIDEIHKYPEWSVELKNILDTYRKHQVIFSGSSTLDLQHSKADLSRRVVYHKLIGLSFREYLKMQEIIDVPCMSLEEIIKNHVKLAEQFRGKPILKHFQNYLAYGYYPFFLEELDSYLFKINNILEKVIFEDLAIIYNLKQSTLNIIKRILWLIATGGSFIPNVDSMSKNLGASREMIYDCIEYLSKSGLTNNIYADAVGMKLVRKPGKIYLNNTNLLHAICGDLKIEDNIGAARETYFVNQVSSPHKIRVPDQGDYIVDDQYIIEIGGRSKSRKQIKKLEDSFLVLDDIEIGFGQKIPLYLFGFLY